jgi:hypothetical protein
MLRNETSEGQLLMNGDARAIPVLRTNQERAMVLIRVKK